MDLIPAGILAGAEIPFRAFAANLVPVTLGNIVSGSGGVAIVYWMVYFRDRRAQPRHLATTAGPLKDWRKAISTSFVI